MQRRHTNFEGLPLTQAVADGLRAQHKATGPLPPRWLELLAKLDAMCGTEVEPSPPTQPEQSADEDGGISPAPDVARSVQFGVGKVLSEEFASTEPVPPSLMGLLAQLEERMKTDMELGRRYGAVDRAVAELVRLGRTEPGRPKKP